MFASMTIETSFPFSTSSSFAGFLSQITAEVFFAEFYILKSDRMPLVSLEKMIFSIGKHFYSSAEGNSTMFSEAFVPG